MKNLFMVLFAIALSACGGGSGTDTETTPTTPTTPPTTTPSSWYWEDIPIGYNLPSVNSDNPMSAAKVDLGRFLFYDKRLSGDGTMSCATCHQQAKAFTDGLARPFGITGQQHPRNSQSLANVIYNTTKTWSNPTLTTLEAQMVTPLFGTGPVEMGVNDSNKDEVLSRIVNAKTASVNPVDYQSKFAASFPGQSNPITWDNIIKAIATFQNSLISFNSKWDQKNKGLVTFTAQETLGEQLFSNEKAECFHCHTPDNRNFTDQFTFAKDLTGNPVVQKPRTSSASTSSASPSGLRALNANLGQGLLRPLHNEPPQVGTPFHNTGQYNITVNGVAGNYPAPNQGKFLFTNVETDKGRFRAPSLRNVELTAPYMHDGSVGTLEEVVAIYARGGRHTSSGPNAGDGKDNPNKSSLIAQINLTAEEQAALVAFLKTLTDQSFVTNPKHSNPFPNP